MCAKEIISEITYIDAYPRGFTAFREKYAHLVGRRDLYVNFTDVVGNTLDKSFSPKPNHGDPQGLYAYPLEYVINHPMDIDYGQQARYLRVIQDTSRHKLDLQTMTREQAVELLGRMGVENPSYLLGIASRKQSLGRNPGRLFLYCLQYYSTVGQKTRLSNADQTRMLRKAGVDALEDTARKTHDAIIYPDEPEQIVFLTRSAFRVIDVFELRNQRSASINTANPTEGLRRLPGLIATAIGDKLEVSASGGDRTSEQVYYTAKRRKIVVRLDGKQYIFGHRSQGVEAPFDIEVRVLGPDFGSIYMRFPQGTSFATVASEVGKQFANRVPDAGDGYDRETDYGGDINHTLDLLKAIAAKLQVPFDVPTSKDVRFRIWQTIEAIAHDISPFSNKENFLKDVVEKYIDNILGTMKKRPSQADQLIALYRAYVAKHSFREAGKLDKMAVALKIRDWTTVGKPIDDAGKIDLGGDASIARNGTDLMLSVDGRTFKMAKITNDKLTEWGNPGGGGWHNQTVMLPHATVLAAYLNKHRYYIDGYYLFIACYYGLTFQHGRWSTMEQSAGKDRLPNGLVIWTIPEGDHWVVAVRVDGEKSFGDHFGPDWKDKKVTWTNLEALFWLDKSKTNITNLGHALERRLRWEKSQKNRGGVHDSGPVYGHWREDSDIVRQTWKTLDADGFDPVAYIKEKGYGFSSSLGDDLSLFGLRVNKDTGKIGKKIADIVKPIGEFAGLPMSSVVVPERPGVRFYLISGEKLREVLRTKTDHYTGEKDTVISWVRDDLTPDERKAVLELITSLKLPVPKKFAPLLKVKKSG